MIFFVLKSKYNLAALSLRMEKFEAGSLWLKGLRCYDFKVFP